MKVRITREPTGVVDGVSLRYYHAGGTYEVPTVLGAYLVAEGYATVEMRCRQRSVRPGRRDRRRH